MLGSCPISSSIEIAFDARTPMVLDMAWRASMASLADRRMFRGVVLSFETSFRTPSACLILGSYSSFRFAFCMPGDQTLGRAFWSQTHTTTTKIPFLVIKRFPYSHVLEFPNG